MLSVVVRTELNVVMPRVSYVAFFRSALLYAPAIYYMSDWFVERRGLAMGTIDAGKQKCHSLSTSGLTCFCFVSNRHCVRRSITAVDPPSAYRQVRQSKGSTVLQYRLSVRPHPHPSIRPRPSPGGSPSTWPGQSEGILCHREPSILAQGQVFLDHQRRQYAARISILCTLAVAAE